jgi:hypothetical protein
LVSRADQIRCGKREGIDPVASRAGVPERVPDPPLDVKVMPAGSVPASESVGPGVPVAVMVKEPALPTVNDVDAAFVKVGTA